MSFAPTSWVLLKLPEFYSNWVFVQLSWVLLLLSQVLLQLTQVKLGEVGVKFRKAGVKLRKVGVILGIFTKFKIYHKYMWHFVRRCDIKRLWKEFSCDPRSPVDKKVLVVRGTVCPELETMQILIFENYFFSIKYLKYRLFVVD